MKAMIATLLIALLPLTASANDAGEAVVGANWGTYTIEWSDGSQLFVRYGVKRHEGMMAVCVAVTSRRGIEYNLIREALRRGSVNLADDTQIIRDLRFGKIYSSRYRNGELVGEVANCKTSRQAEQDGLSYRMVFPRGTYRIER